MEDQDQEMTGVAALNALDRDEREAVERRARASEETREELRGFEDTAALLALGAGPVAPPARIKANVMAAIRSTPQLPALDEQGTASADAHGAGADDAAAHPGAGPAVVDLREARGRRAANPRTVRLLAAAAGILVVATGGLAGVVAVQGGEQERLEQQLATAEATQAQFVRLFAAADLKTASQRTDSGAVNLTYSAAEGMMAVSARLPELPEDKAYELWLISPDGASPAGLMTADAVRGGDMKMVSGAMDGVTHFGITVEPATGSDQPTTAPIVLQEL